MSPEFITLISDRKSIRFAYPANKDINRNDKFRITHIGGNQLETKQNVLVRNITPTPDMASLLLIETNLLSVNNEHRAGELCRVEKY